MKTQLIWNKDKTSFLRMFSDEKVEGVNPIEYYRNSQVKKAAILIQDHLFLRNPFLASYLDNGFFIKKAEEELEGFVEGILKTEVPRNFITLLETPRKKDQEKLLRDQTITPEQLMALVFRSYKDHDYLYSKYRYEHLAKGTESYKLPKAINVNDDGTVETIGETELSEGQLRDVVKQRKVIVAHIFERKGLWHSLFLTYNSIRGEENWNNGQAHYHYISSSFGVTKEQFIESMKSGNYLSTPFHIKLLDYGHQVK